MKNVCLPLFSILLFLISCSPETSQDAEAPENYSILFYSGRTGNGDLYAIDTEGKNLTQIIFGDSSEYAGRWLTGTEYITLTRQKGNSSEILKKSLLTGEEEFIFANPAFEESPEWHPDGKSVVFTGEPEQGSDLFLANSEGEILQRLTQDSLINKQPVFSSSGEQLLFVSNRSGNQDIWMMDIETRVITNLTKHPALEGHPKWGPDDESILFYRYENGNADLYTLNLKTRASENLTRSPVNELIGSFSPDGKYLAYGGIADDDWEIFIANADGSNPRRLTRDQGFDGDPVWIPSKYLPRND